LPYISEANRNESGNGTLNFNGNGMKNLGGEMGRGRVWRRPVKIKELETRDKVVGTLREIDFVVNR
jgi:hypothetical protein